jgi:hypothetical protein
VKEEVMTSMLTSFLETDLESALFWAYELYFSGYEQETLIHLQKIYYYLFACQNPDLEEYIIGLCSNVEKHYIIHDIVQTMILRPFDTDVLLLHRIATYLDYEVEMDTFDLHKMSYTDLAAYIVNHPEEHDTLLSHSEEHDTLLSHSEEHDTLFGVLPKVVPLVKPLLLLSRCLRSISISPSLVSSSVVSSSTNKYVEYMTSELKPAYTVLKTVCRPIDPHQYLFLFGTPRTKIPSYMQIYHSCWLVCASYSPIWAKRIAIHGGTVQGNKVVFKNEVLEESFYTKYGYEPDEQSMEVQYRNMCPILPGKTWSTIVRKRLFPQNEDDEDLLKEL